jgi:hypothetical protein
MTLCSEFPNSSTFLCRLRLENTVKPVPFITMLVCVLRTLSLSNFLSCMPTVPLPWRPRSFRLKAFYCTVRGCKKKCSTPSGLQRHVQAAHEIPRALLLPSTLPRSTSQPPEYEHQTSSPTPRASPEPPLNGGTTRVTQLASPHGPAARPRHLKVLKHPLIDGQFKFAVRCYVHICCH